MVSAHILLFYEGFLYFKGVLNKTIIPIGPVRYEMIIANSALRALLAIYHLISTERAFVKQYDKLLVIWSPTN